jgi:hypothetical protein
MTSRKTRATLAAALSAIVVCAIALRTQQSFYSDPAQQMKTALQFVAGASPAPNDWVRPDYDDLSRDVEEPLVVWAPGTSLVFVPFVRAGFSPAVAARIVAALALILGAAGWARWCAAFDLPDAIVFLLAVGIGWLRFASNAVFLYNSEILVFAAVPGVLLAAMAADRARGARRFAAMALVGLAAGALYVVKYSASFVTAAVLAWVAWRSLRREASPEGSLARRAAPVLVAIVASAAPVIALSAWNRSHGGAANLMFATFGIRWDWAYVAHALAAPALTAADLASLLGYVLMHPVHGVTQNASWLTAIGFPGGLLLAWFALRPRVNGAPADLARSVFGVSLVAIVVVWTMSTVVSIESRHLASAGFAMLPLALAEGRARWPGATRPMRAMLACAVMSFVAAPFAYGVVSVAAKAMRYPPAYRTGPSGIYNPLLAERDAASVAAALTVDCAPDDDVWYLVEPLTNLDLGGRAIVRNADFIPVEALRQDRFRTSRRLRVRALLPPRFELNGKAAAIRASFPQATRWSRSTIAGAEYDLWTTILEPGDVR